MTNLVLLVGEEKLIPMNLSPHGKLFSGPSTSSKFSTYTEKASLPLDLWKGHWSKHCVWVTGKPIICYEARPPTNRS